METKENREYKDSIFRYLFKEPDNFRVLYEDITGTKLDTGLEFYDTYNLITKQSLVNDVSFKTSDNRLIIMVEHQSTNNMNMTLRSCMYYFKIMEQYIKEYGLNIYGSKPIKLPAPEFYVVYNGINDTNVLEYSLSSNFDSDNDTIIARTKIIDIKYDKLDEEIKASKDTLVGYSYLIDRISFYNKTQKLSISEAATKAVEECKEKELLIDYIGRKEFLSMSVDNYTIEQQLKDEREFGLEEGLEKGEFNERLRTAKELIAEGITKEKICKITLLSEDIVDELLKNN